MEVYREQLNILLHAMKAVVQTKGCPDWVAYKLNAAVKEAKEYKPTGNEVGAVEKKFCELYPGMHVHSLRQDRNEGLLLNLHAMPKSYICKCLMDDMAFKGFAKQDFKQLSDYDKERIKAAVPRELYNFLNG